MVHANPYGDDKQIEKLERVGHYPASKTKKRGMKGKKLSDGKSLGSCGCLREASTVLWFGN